MLRQVFDWAASRSTELLTRYKQMATNIGLTDNVNSYEYREIFQELNMKAREVVVGRIYGPSGTDSERDLSGEPFQPCHSSRKRRRRQSRTQENSLESVQVDVPTGLGKRRCSSAGRISKEEPLGSEMLELGGLTLSFSRRIRLPLTKAAQAINDTEYPDKETYAQIVKTPKAARDEWIKELNELTEIMTTELYKWWSRFRVFSVSVDVTMRSTGELGDSRSQDSLKHQILMRRLKKKLREFFGEISVINEVVVWQDGTKHKSIHIGPTEDALEMEMKSQKLTQKAKNLKTPTRKEIEVVRERGGPATLSIEELEDSFSGVEDKFWNKQDHYLKRKSGKASRKRLRALDPSTVPVASKKDVAHLKTMSDAKLHVSNKCKSEIQPKRELELKRRETACCIAEKSNPSNSPLGPEYEDLCLPKRLQLMQSRYRRFVKKLEKMRRDGKLQTGNLRR